jgi:hypothetical protein
MAHPQNATSKNGTTAPAKPAPTKTEAIDLTFDVADPALKIQGESGLISHMHKLDAALASQEAISDKRDAVVHEIAGRLHAKGFSRVWIKDTSLLDKPVDGADPYVIRQINGRPGTYNLLPEKPRKVKKSAGPVDLTDV